MWKYGLAVVFAALALWSMTLIMPSKPEHHGFFVFKKAQWTTPDGKVTKVIPPSGPLVGYNAELDQCCIGRYTFSVSSEDVSRTVGPLADGMSLYFPTLGGDFVLRINGVLVDLPKRDYSSVGPVIPISTAMISGRSDLAIDVQLLGPGIGFVGAWKAAPMIGKHFAVVEHADRERQYQIDLPIVMSIPMLFFAGIFGWLYVSTGRQFSFYALFAVGIFAIGIFELYLGGVARRIDLAVGSVTHYPARILAAMGAMLLVESYVAWTGNRRRFKPRWRHMVLGTQSVLAVGVLAATASQSPSLDVILTSIAIVITFVPMIAWRLSSTRVFSWQFLAYIAVTTVAFGNMLDAFKLVSWRYGIAVPYAFFDRYTAPILVSQTLVIYLIHFVLFFKKTREQASVISRQKALSDAFQMIAHDLRKPFSRMRLGLSMIEAEGFIGNQRQTVDQVRAEVERNLSSVDGILSDILEAGRTAKPTASDEDIESVFDEIIAELAGQFGEKRIKIEKALSHSRYVLIDETRVRRALMNLVENALQALQQEGGEGRLWFKTRDVGDKVEMIIGNTGRVIPMDNWSKVVEAFETYHKRGGTGLGLAIVKKIVEAHGGSISCRSTLATGTEFTVLWPAGRPLAEVKQPRLSSPT